MESSLCNVDERPRRYSTFAAASVVLDEQFGVRCRRSFRLAALQSLFSLYDIAAGHLRRYRRETLAGELDGLGVDVLEMRYWGFTMLPVLMLRKLRFLVSPGTGEVLRQGFVPPGDLAHGVLRMMMRAETSVLPRPPLGTSLLLVARKG